MGDIEFGRPRKPPRHNCYMWDEVEGEVKPTAEYTPEDSWEVIAHLHVPEFGISVVVEQDHRAHTAVWVIRGQDPVQEN